MSIYRKSLKYLFRYYLVFMRVFALCFIVSFLSVQIFQAIRIPSYGAWGIFHYYLGSKYIKELGYFGLYSCAIEANSADWQTTRLVRNLYTYQLVRPTQLPKC